MSIEVSIIIPIKDEHDKYISRCIDSLKKQYYCSRFEILVVMGGNRAQARNLGIKQAQGEIIAFIDADCVAPEKWLFAIVECLKKNSTLGGIGGTNFSPEDKSCLGKAVDAVFSSFLGSLGSTSLTATSKPRFVSALACINSVFYRETLQSIGGFDEEFELCEDTNLSYKVRGTGRKLLFVKDIPVWHYRRDTIKRFAKQFFFYGVGRMRSMLTNKAYSAKGATVLFVAALIFPLIALFSPLFAAGTIALYLSAIFVVALRATVKTKKISFLYLIPGLLIVEHFTYLFGMIYGVTKGKWKKPTSNPEVFYREVSKDTPIKENIRFHLDASFNSETFLPLLSQ
jgi:cellulose synthase/poly-beta-1,6-N-acetylglucosamine synthase-like glycosyltransferase